MVKQDTLFEEEILIPKERVAVLIGQKGEVKRKIERLGNVKLRIKATEGIVKISSNDALSLWTAKKVIEAIGRGFNPEIAQKIFKEGNSFELINLRDYVGNSKKRLERLRGRIIGTRGKTRRLLEKYTETKIAIYGKTVCIIGPSDKVQLARHAIELILSGAKQGTAYHFLEKQKEMS